jgi:uncharacterized UPF0160 family protein
MENAIKEVMEITGYTQAKAEKYFKQVQKDLCEDCADTTTEDILEFIRIEKKVKDNGIKTVARAETPKKAPTVYKFDTEKSKNRKKDEEKVEIVQKIADFLQDIVQNAEIVNEGQKISFEIGENSYSLTLTKHRSAKK